MAKPAVAIIVTLLAVAAVARAQPATLPRPWEDPDAVDIDDQKPQSRFWDRTLHPHRDRFERELKQALPLLSSRRPDDVDRAKKMLLEMVVLEPEDARGWFYLGHAHFLQREWPECAAAYRKVTVIDPKLTEMPALPGQPAVSQWIDLALGQCMSLSGDPSGAIVRFQRAFIALPAQVARGSFELPWRMGEAYMALGRLDVAIGYLRRAAELQGLLTMTYRRPGAEILVLYALAAAYDRDEQLDAARTIMEKVVPWEGNAMTTLSRPDLRVAPPEDVYYYKAMLKESPTRAGDRVVPAQAPEQSLVLYRQFAKLHGGGPWARRARAHIDALRRDPLSARGVKPGGSATFDTGVAAVQIGKVDEQLQRCVKDVPTALFDVSITANAAGRGTRRNEPVMVLGTGPSPLGPGVTAKAYLDFTGAPEAIAAAGQCLEDVARGIKLPPPAGPPGTWGQVTFPVAWQGQ